MVRTLSVFFWRDITCSSPPPDFLQAHWFLQRRWVFYCCGELQGICLFRAGIAFYDVELIAVADGSGQVRQTRDVSRNTGGLNNQRLAVPSPHGMTQCARSLICGDFAAVQKDCPPRIPFAVSEFESVSATLSDLELVWRKHLTGQAPRLTTKKPRIVRRVERISLQGARRQVVA